TGIDDRTQGNGFGSIGIRAGTGQNDTIAYNTVLMTDSTGQFSAAMQSTWSADPNRSQVWLNNIGINLRKPFLKNSSSFAFVIDDSLGNIVANHNNWYSLSDPNMFIAGYSSGSHYTDLSEWQKRGKDINSISVNANFVSTADLHIDSTKATMIYSGGTPVSGIFADIDGQERNPFKPCIGADEFIGLVSDNDIGVTTIQRLVSSDTLKFRVLVRNFGASVQNTYAIHYTGDTTVVSGEVNNTRPLLVGGTDTLFINWAKPSQGIHELKAWTMLANDQDRSNDTAVANIFVSTGWTLNLSGTQNNLQSVKAVNEKIAWAAGEGPKVLRTTDGGATWTSTGIAGIPASIYNIEALDQNIAMVSSNPNGQPAQILRTGNGGASWTSVFAENGGFINAVKMYSSTGGYAVGDPVSKSFTVVKTTDAGITWERTGAQPARLSNLVQPEYGLNNSLFVFGQNNLWFGTTYGRVIRTTDGGTSWEASQTPINGEIDRVVFNGTKFGVAGGLDAIARTTDGGVTWTQVTTGGTGYVLGLSAIGNTFWAAQGRDVFVSFDLGKTWLLTFVGSSDFIRDLNFVGGPTYQRGWGVGESGLIITYHNFWTGTEDLLTGIPTEFALDQNYPNPFNPATTIRYALPTNANVSIRIFDILGREVRSLMNEQTAAGFHKVEWNGRNNSGLQVASGMYIYRIEAGSFVATKKMMLLK
ncbi:MAG: YCF48-related protein, partial [Bacteroidota bacterium]